MAQMTIIERNSIEDALRRGFSIPEIARMTSRPPQTITNEIKSRRIDSNKNCKSTNAMCKWYGECRRTQVCGTNCGLKKQCKRCHQCFLQCSNFELRVCERLFTPPFVCNGCRDESHCHLPKKYYIAKVAQADRESKLHESRKGVHADKESLVKMNAALKNGLHKKQSIRHIMAANPGTFGKLTERTIYSYVNGKLFDVGRGDLPYACTRKRKAKTLVTKTDAKCRVGRTYQLFVQWKLENPGVGIVEADTLKGKIGGAVLFTLIFECGLALAFLKERETAQTWTGIVNMLYRIAGRTLFMKLFPCFLEDNGAPFSDPVMTENARAEHNPYKLIPRSRVFYCDPYCATQKPHIERVHEELRRILIKGSSFDLISQDDVCVAISHINSYSRPTLGNSTPFDEFVKIYGEDGRIFLEHLGVVRIPPNEVTLDPFLLGKKFKRHADKIILKKAGVSK